MSSALVFLFVLSVLVVVHEFGHFIVAKLVGIAVVAKQKTGARPECFCPQRDDGSRSEQKQGSPPALIFNGVGKSHETQQTGDGKRQDALPL